MKIKITKCSWDKALERKELDVSKITKKGPKVPAYFQDFIDNMFIPLVNMVKVDHELLTKDHEVLIQVKQKHDQDHELIKKVIKLNNLKTE